MDQDRLLAADGIGRLFGRDWAVRDLSVELQRGEVLGILGPNGAGKTTSLHLLTGNLAPTAGHITIGGFDLAEAPRRAKARLGYLPEQPPLYRDLNVGEYLRYCARLRGIPWRQAGAAARRAQARTGLAGLDRRLLGQLSKGYQQRAGIAQAIVHEPSVVILDEPTVGLDPIQIQDIRALIRELGESHGVILSTHILPEVQVVCDRVMILAQGRAVYTNRVSALAEAPAIALRVRFDQAPSPDELSRLPGVERVETLGDGAFRLHHGGDATAAPAVARHATEQGLGLLELTPERESLETVFLRHTGGEPTTEAAA